MCILSLHFSPFQLSCSVTSSRKFGMKKKEKNNRATDINLPRRTNDQQSSNNPPQMTDLPLSQPNLMLMEEEEDDQNRRNPNQKHRKAKRLRANGCSELDTMACGTLEEASHSHEISSTDENDVDVEVNRSTSPSTSGHSSSSEDSKEIDQMNESVKMLAEAFIAWVEEMKKRFEERKRKVEDERKRKDERKYTIEECMKVLDEMEPKIADDVYILVLKMLQEKGWLSDIFGHER